MREKILFDDDWRFHKGEIEEFIPPRKGPIYGSAKTECMLWGPASINYNDISDYYYHDKAAVPELWETVHLPHDYIINSEISRENNNTLGFFKYENAWYRKHFDIPECDDGRRISLLFEGVATRCTVYLNGCELKHNNCGYTSFEVDLTDYVNYGGENVLAVHVMYGKNEGWWYQGGGIYRHVWLVKTELVHVANWGVAIRTRKKSASLWQITTATEVENETCERASVKAVSHLIDGNGNEVCSFYSRGEAGELGKTEIVAEAETEAPRIWDIDSPNLYLIKTELFAGENSEEPIDTVINRFGFRDFEFTAEGFFLNGRRVFINGVCGHGDFGLTGKAVPDNILRHKVMLMKEMGANGYRSSHYPQAEATLDAMDETGFIVMDETRWFTSSDDGIEQLEMLIKRDRNHPSVFVWSLGNEEPHHLTETGRKIFKKLRCITNKLDGTRPTTSAVSNSPDKATVYDDMDVVGINYNHWLYDVVRDKYPDKPVFSSECCATSTTRGWYEDDDESRGYISAYDHDSTNWFIGREKFMDVITSHPWVCGMYQWIAFEHRGETLWPRICSQSGAIDLFLQKKDAFYQNQSLFVTAPMIHIMPHWNWKHKAGEKIRVAVYTTCDECELLLNGKSLGKKQCERYKHLEWSVTFEPGTLKAVGYVDGKKAAEDCAVTSDAPARLMLRLENTESIKADSESIALFTCYCVDKNGVEVPDAAPFVRFFTNGIGTVAGTGSDVCDHIPVGTPERRMRAGKISVAVKVKDKPGRLSLTAVSDALETAYITVDIEK